MVNKKQDKSSSGKMTAQQKLAELQAQDSGKTDTPKPALENEKLNVTVLSPYDIHFEGKSNSLSATNATGPFDVLPGHANFITLLSPGNLVIETDYGKQSFKIPQSILRVHDNSITIFLNI